MRRLKLGVPMFSSVRSSTAGSRLCRTLTAVALTTGLSVTGLTGSNATSARTADADITCTASQNVYAVAPGGALMRHQFNDLSTTASPVLVANPDSIGSGFSNFPKLTAGPDGWLYATSASGTWAYHWTGTTWDVLAKSLGTAFKAYADPTRLNKLTIDSRGDFWAVLDDGTLQRLQYNATANTFSGRPMASGWGIYNSITAAGDGVIYARTTAGVLHRYHFETSSDRLISRTVFGGGWNNYSKLTSVGGDTLLGVDPSNQLIQYRYRPAPDGTWALSNHVIGGGWVFLNVVGTSNACKLTTSFVPAAPPVPTEQNSAMAVLQTAGGKLDYSYTDNIGQAQWGHQPDASDFGGTAWTAIHGSDAFTGTPGLVEGADNKVDITLHNVNSRFAGRVQAAPGSTQVSPVVLDRGGLMASGSVSTKNLSNNKIVMFAVDGSGALWAKAEGTGGLLAWQKYPSPVLSGVPAVGPGPGSTTMVLARDTAGTYWAAKWNGSELSAFSSLGGTGFVGKASIVRYPGDMLRVFAKDATGHLVTQKQTAPGTAFPGTWQTIAPTQTWPGSPGAIMSPASGLIEILVRGADGKSYFAQEIAQGSGTWGVFKDMLPLVNERYAPDPAPFTYTADGVSSWALATYTQDFQPRVITARSVSEAKAGSKSGGDPETPVFTLHELPAAPK
jgi:hypothetical protein